MIEHANIIWKNIPEYEGLYLISNYGDIKSLHNYRKGNILKPKIRKGYYQIGLRKNGKRKWYAIHRLVAKTFLNNENNFPQVNHKDENKLNNYVENLEFCTASYNNKYGTRLERVANSNKLRKEVIKYNLEGKFIEEYKSVSEAGRKNNINISCISACCRNTISQTHNYIFKFKGGGANAN